MVANETRMWVKLVKIVWLLGIPRNLFPCVLWLPWLVLREKEKRLPPLMGFRNSRPVTRKEPLKPLSNNQDFKPELSKLPKLRKQLLLLDLWGHERSRTIRAFSLWPCRQPLWARAPKQNILENFRPLAKKTTEGGRYKAAGSIIYTWDHVCFIDQSQGPNSSSLQDEKPETSY